MPPLPLTDTYGASRVDFLDRALVRNAVIRSYPMDVVDDETDELAIDVAWLGPEDATDVVVVVSGTHGVEGFGGSALQRTWLRDQEPERPGDIAVCLVHALNPYGFAHIRRVNEANIDLNRNFADVAATNRDYDEIADLLVPSSWSEQVQAETTGALLEKAGEWGFDRFQQAVSGGQYAHPTGLFYGGDGPAWSHQRLRLVAAELLRGRDHVAIVDLHTGLGPWGHGELISSHGPGDGSYDRAVDWYGEVTSLVVGDSVSAELSGEWLPAIADSLEATGTASTAVALEYGTVDTVAVLQALRADAWLHAHGDPAGPEAPPVKAQLRAAFADDDPSWIATLEERFLAVLDATFGGLRH